MSDGPVLQAQGGGRFSVGGAITIETAPAVVAEGAALLAAAGPEVEVDVSGLAAFDSAALGVFFEWQRRGAGRGQRVRFSNLPPKLATLARLYGVDGLLAPQAAA